MKTIKQISEEYARKAHFMRCKIYNYEKTDNN